jgi:sec-independent protein translocase protein TatA
MEGLLQPTHLILILGIALLTFGPRKLPELGQGLGKGIRGFRDALRGISVDPSGPEPQTHPVPSDGTSASTHDTK